MSSESCQAFPALRRWSFIHKKKNKEKRIFTIDESDENELPKMNKKKRVIQESDEVPKKEEKAGPGRNPYTTRELEKLKSLVILCDNKDHDKL